MKINGVAYRSIWIEPQDPETVYIFDQRELPHRLVVEPLRTVEEAAIAIREMHTRGAPMIGMTAAFGLYLAAVAYDGLPDFEARIHAAADMLKATRPTAVNLAWAVDQQLAALVGVTDHAAIPRLLKKNAEALAEADAELCRNIGVHGLRLIEEIAARKPGQVVNILTHCNAGWLACVDYGTATAPMYLAHDAGIPIHVWVDETRPRNQGARLTAYELGQHGVPHTVIADNTGGHLMQHGQVDIIFVGADRVTTTGDTANKIGTYLKALAAKDNHVPFYVALPSNTFDWTIRDGIREIPIEQRGDDEVKYMDGISNGKSYTILITPASSPAANYGFDVTPARLITGLITERGVHPATEEGIRNAFPERF
jgi:methylthioribose-1-phosphate isomerase